MADNKNKIFTNIVNDNIRYVQTIIDLKTNLRELEERINFLERIKN